MCPCTSPGTSETVRGPGGSIVDNARREVPGGGNGEEPVEVLRAKYLDYCSARITEAVLNLSADEMYVLAEQALRDSGRGLDESLTYGDIVALATQRISRCIELPTFDDWCAAYREDPTRFEGELLGFWEREVESSPEG